MKKSVDFSRIHNNVKAIGKVFFDTSDCDAWVANKKCKSSLAIGGIVSNRLYESLSYELNFFPLKEDSYTWFIKYSCLDLLLVESMLEDYSGHWEMSLTSQASFDYKMKPVLEIAKNFNIPSAFWMTHGVEYYNLYKDAAKSFDYIFCADAKAVERFSDDGVKAFFLPPCVQEKIYNPITKSGDDRSVNILFEDWVALDKNECFKKLLKRLERFNPCVVDSKNITFKRRFKESLLGVDCNGMGSVSFKQRLGYLRNSKVKVTSALTNMTATGITWECMEAAASGCVIITHGELSDNIAKKLFVSVGTDDEVELEVLRLLKDNLYRERLSHIVMREIFNNHTFSHRLKDMFQIIGLPFEWVEYPLISFVVPTIRPENLNFIYDTFCNQNYPEKELIVVFNSNDIFLENIDSNIKRDQRVKITQIPSDYFTGGALNLGIENASGEYIIKADDDDFYFENYAADMVMWARLTDADFFGKNSAPLIFEGDERLYYKRDQQSLRFLNSDDLTGGVWISGNTLSGKKDFFNKVLKFSNYGYGAVDSIFYLSLPEGEEIKSFLCDYFNMAALRLLDTSKHTWQVSAEKLKSKRDYLDSVEEYRV